MDNLSGSAFVRQDDVNLDLHSNAQCDGARLAQHRRLYSSPNSIHLTLSHTRAGEPSPSLETSSSPQSAIGKSVQF